MKEKKYYKFYECCRIVKGINRAIVYDLQRSNIYYMPNSLVDIFLAYQNKTIDSLFNDYSSEKEPLEEYYNYLLDNEIIFITNEPESFPPLNIGFKKPHKLDFLFIEIDNLQDFKIKFLQKSIDRIGINEIVIINKNNSIENLNSVLNSLINSRVKSIIFITSFSEGLIRKILSLKIKHKRLKRIFFYNTPKKKFNNIQDNDINYSINSLTELLTRKIEKIGDFVMNKDAYLESLNYNLYFNRRIYINNLGNVKPSYTQNKFYGNIENESIEDIILKDGFQDLWKITKDQIEVCKDCEYRYMCPDNRVPIKLKNKRYYHKTVCNYSPYTNLWKPLKNL